MNSTSNPSPVEQTGVQRRIHAQPQLDINNDFVVQIPGALVDAAIANKLTAAEWSLWFYLQRITPFADFTRDGEPIYRSVPSPTNLAVILGRDRKTIERAGQRLNKLGLYCLRAKSWEGFNATAHEGKKLLADLKTKKSHTEALPSNNENSGKPSLPKKPSTESTFSNNENSGDYLTPNGTKKSQSGLNNPNLGLNNPNLGLNNPKTEIEASQGKDSGASQTLQTFQTYSDSTDNNAVDEKIFDGKENATTPAGVKVDNSAQPPTTAKSKGSNEAEIFPEDQSASTSLNNVTAIESDIRAELQGGQDFLSEPTGILEDLRPDPIVSSEQAAAELLDKREIFNELRRMGVELNNGVRETMKRFKANVPGAIAHLRQRYDNREKFGNITGAFVKACTDGAKPRSSSNQQINPPTEEQLTALDAAKTAGKIKDYYFTPCEDGKMLLVDTGRCVQPWWEFLEQNPELS